MTALDEFSVLHPDSLFNQLTDSPTLQIARGVLQHIAAVTGGELDGFEADIDLEDLLETYGMSLPDCRECEGSSILPVPWQLFDQSLCALGPLYACAVCLSLPYTPSSTSCHECVTADSQSCCLSDRACAYDSAVPAVKSCKLTL